ncbi:MAG: hypothetical protein HRT89_19535 [Lentisphaeria bacterium]|nr:hypothetical protein [Lentisphaeria bacterium]NQZ70250.1 hypothetical protein [Lentisphaeria bacterium]
MKKLILLILVTLAACSKKNSDQSTKDKAPKKTPLLLLNDEPRLRKSLGGDDDTLIIKEHDKAFIYRIKYQKEEPFKGEVSDAIPISSENSKTLASLILSHENYYWPKKNGDWKPCSPIPGVKLSFHKKEKRYEILLCFECSILIAKGVQLDFDYMPADFYKIIKSSFPDDEKIQVIRNSPLKPKK